MSDSASYDSGGSRSNNISEKKKVIRELNASSFTKRPKIVATCFCARKPGYYIFNAYFLIFLITISSLTIFSVDCKLPQNRLQITYTILLTSVSFKWVINRSLPTVSYLTSLDAYAIICIFFVCLLCAWHALVGSFWHLERALFLDFWMLIAFSSLFLLINVGVSVWFYRAYDKIRQLIRKESLFLRMLKENNEKVNSDFEFNL